jgi:acetylornithine deacetylase
VASHLDTVPVDSMTIDPFDPVVKDGRLQGRGSCDTKAGMAALMAALERVLERGTLKRNLVVVGEADEEAESVGVRDVLAHLGSARIDFAIATEPTELRLVNAHKGTALVRVVGRGRACHSSDPSLGANAIVALSHAVLSLTRLGQRLVEGKAHQRLGPATLSIGVIWGGQAPNIVPDSATLLMDRRTLPGETLDDIRDEVQAAFERDGVTNVEIAGVQAGKQPLHTDESHAATLACQRALRRAGLDAPVEPVPFGTDAGLFAREGIPSLVLGPGSIHRAHTDAEYVEIDQLERMVDVFEHLLRDE